MHLHVSSLHTSPSTPERSSGYHQSGSCFHPESETLLLTNLQTDRSGNTADLAEVVMPVNGVKGVVVVRWLVVWGSESECV